MRFLYSHAVLLQRAPPYQYWYTRVSLEEGRFIVLLSHRLLYVRAGGIPLNLLLWGSPCSWYQPWVNSGRYTPVHGAYGYPRVSPPPRYTGGSNPPRPTTIGFPAFMPYVPTSRPVQGCLNHVRHVPTHRAGLLGALGAGQSTLGVRPGWSQRS